MSNKTHKELVDDAQNQSKVIALIYSPIELHEYLVEIISKDSNAFLRKKNQITHFHSVSEALSQAANHGAEEFFLGVDNTYDECGSMGPAQKFDFIPIHSKYKRPSH